MDPVRHTARSFPVHREGGRLFNFAGEGSRTAPHRTDSYRARVIIQAPRALLKDPGVSACYCWTRWYARQATKIGQMMGAGASVCGVCSIVRGTSGDSQVQ